MDSESLSPPHGSGVSSWTPEILEEAASLALFPFGSQSISDFPEMDYLIYLIKVQTG